MGQWKDDDKDGYGQLWKKNGEGIVGYWVENKIMKESLVHKKNHLESTDMEEGYITPQK